MNGFKGNVSRGDEIFTALGDAVTAAKADVGAARAADLN